MVKQIKQPIRSATLFVSVFLKQGFSDVGGGFERERERKGNRERRRRRGTKKNRVWNRFLQGGRDSTACLSQ